jgi:hypothetical protein
MSIIIHSICVLPAAAAFPPLPELLAAHHLDPLLFTNLQDIVTSAPSIPNLCQVSRYGLAYQGGRRACV